MSAHVVGDHSESLSVQQLKKRLYGQLKDTGVVDTLRTQLRTSLIRELRAKSLGGKLDKGHSEQSIKYRVLNSLVCDYMQACGFGYAVSIFVSESGLSKLILNKTDLLQVLRIDPDSHMYSRLLADSENVAPTESSLLYRIFDTLPSFGQRARDSMTQTDVDIYAQSIDVRLDEIDVKHALRQSHDEMTSVEEKMIAYKAECDERAKAEVAAEIARFKEHELALIRSQEQEDARRAVEAAEKKFEKMYEEQLKNARNREGIERNRVSAKEQELEKSNYDLRQRLMQQMENIRSQEADLKRQAELNERAAQIEQQRLRDKELSINEISAKLEQDKARLRKDADQRFADFKIDLQNTYDEKNRQLRRDFALLEEQRNIFQREKDAHTVLLSEASTLREDLRDAYLRIERLQEELRLSHERIRIHNETVAVEKSEHQQLVKDLSLMKGETERLRRTLLDQKSETHTRVQELELLAARLQHELGMAKEDLASERASRTQAVDEARNESKLTYSTGLAEWKKQEQEWSIRREKLEVERSSHLKEIATLRRQLEEAELTARSTERELSDMRMLFRQTQAVLGESGLPMLTSGGAQHTASPNVSRGTSNQVVNTVTRTPCTVTYHTPKGDQTLSSAYTPGQAEDRASATGAAVPVLSTKAYASYDKPSHSGPPTAADMASAIGSALGADWLSEVEMARKTFELLEREDAELREKGDSFVNRVVRDERQTELEQVTRRSTTRVEEVPSTPVGAAAAAADVAGGEHLGRWATRTSPPQPVPPSPQQIQEEQAKILKEEREAARQQMEAERQKLAAEQKRIRDELERERTELANRQARLQQEHDEQAAKMAEEKQRLADESARKANEALESMKRMAQEAEQRRKREEEDRVRADKQARDDAERLHQQHMQELQLERERIAKEEAERREAFERRQQLEADVIEQRNKAALEAAERLSQAVDATAAAAAATVNQSRSEEANSGDRDPVSASASPARKAVLRTPSRARTRRSPGAQQSSEAITEDAAQASLSSPGSPGSSSKHRAPSASPGGVMSFSASATPVRHPRPISPIRIHSSSSSGGSDQGATALTTSQMSAASGSTVQTPKRTAPPPSLSAEHSMEETGAGATSEGANTSATAAAVTPIKSSASTGTSAPLDPVQQAIERERQRVATQRAQEQAWRAEAEREREEQARAEAEAARQAEAERKAKEEAERVAEEERIRNDPLTKYQEMVAKKREEERLHSADSSKGMVSETEISEVSGLSGADSIAGVESMSGSSGGDSGW